MRLIDADALEKVFEKIPEEKLCNGCFDAVVNAIAYAPTVTPEPKNLILEKEYFEDDDGDEVECLIYLCPECGANCSRLDHFCTNCGQAVKWDG